jgi:hypothetical protein
VLADIVFKIDAVTRAKKRANLDEQMSFFLFLSVKEGFISSWKNP